MTYLATEILLYLLSAAVIGLALGWLIWGLGQRRRLGALRSDLMAKVEAGKEAHGRTKIALDNAEARTSQAVEAATAEAGRSLAELRLALDAERLAAREARTELERMQGKMDDVIQDGWASGQEAVQQAMQAAQAEKAIAAEAMAKEARSRAQVEELRLLIGAEKLAAENVRAELEAMRASMEAELAAERAASSQAKTALDDIRSTLARTLGTEVLDAAMRDQIGLPASSSEHVADHDEDSRAPSDARPEPVAERRAAAPPGIAADIVAAGEALNNPDLDEADIEDREDMSLDLRSTFDAEPEPAVDEADEIDDVDEEDVAEEGTAADDVAEEDGEEAEHADGEAASDEVSEPAPDRIQLRPLPAASARPSIFFDDRPDRTDDLQAIDGIGPELERRLHDNGCYHYRQIATLTSADIDWLAEAIDVSSDQIADGWVEQAKGLQPGDADGADHDADADGGSILAEHQVDQRNAAG